MKRNLSQNMWLHHELFAVYSVACFYEKTLKWDIFKQRKLSHTMGCTAQIRVENFPTTKRRWLLLCCPSSVIFLSLKPTFCLFLFWCCFLDDDQNEDESKQREIALICGTCAGVVIVVVSLTAVIRTHSNGQVQHGGWYEFCFRWWKTEQK